MQGKEETQMGKGGGDQAGERNNEAPWNFKESKNTSQPNPPPL